MNVSRLRAIPSVERMVQALGDVGLPRAIVLDVVRRELRALRSQRVIPQTHDVVARMRVCLQDVAASRIRPVINGTGILVHTNFGRAPLGGDVIEALSTVGA